MRKRATSSIINAGTRKLHIDKRTPHIVVLQSIVVSVECIMPSFTASALMHDLMPRTRIGARYLWSLNCLVVTKSTVSVL